MKIKITVKQGMKVLAEVEGREMPDQFITVDDLKRIPTLEVFLERLTGLRFHVDPQ